jgi:hypothetical protein
MDANLLQDVTLLYCWLLKASAARESYQVQRLGGGGGSFASSTLISDWARMAAPASFGCTPPFHNRLEHFQG